MLENVTGKVQDLGGGTLRSRGSFPAAAVFRRQRTGFHRIWALANSESKRRLRGWARSEAVGNG